MSEFILCMSLAMFKESEGEGTRGMVAVGDTIITRSIETNRDVCSIVLEPSQFSWTLEIKELSIPSLVDYQADTLISIGLDERRLNAYREACRLARLMNGVGYKRSYSFNHFYRCGHKPYWAKKSWPTKIGNHCFLIERK